ncbi:MAG: ThiF family adenylyltransferase [Myxococcota bacterium]
MSRELISLSPDLQRLVDEGYEVSIRSGHLVIENVPYVTSNREVARGALVSELTLSGDRTGKPGTHVIMFTGEHHPCHISGQRIEAIVHQAINTPIDGGLVARHSFSNKPAGGYNDYFEKVDTYATILAGPAAALDPHATAKTFRPQQAPEDSPFSYPDTASSRAGISEVTRKLEGHRLAIVGLGGTGAYVLDLVAKTPVAEIHVFDFDGFFTHNAFRMPGAPSLETLRQSPTKVEYLRAQYTKMHRGIVAHDVALDERNVSVLEGFDFVFICIDDGAAKGPIMEFLEQRGMAFIDVGIGVEVQDGMLGGVVRVTTSTPAKREHVRHQVSTAPPALDDAYRTNIQIAELNALNACLAVIRWKKLLGFYRDFEREHSTTYTIDGNMLLSEEQGCA